jgi:hypothetical protein
MTGQGFTGKKRWRTAGILLEFGSPLKKCQKIQPLFGVIARQISAIAYSVSEIACQAGAAWVVFALFKTDGQTSD